VLEKLTTTARMPLSFEATMLLKLKEVAKRLNCSKSNVYSLVATGELLVHRVGLKKGLRVSEEDLAAYLAKVRGEFEHVPLPTPATVRPLQRLTLGQSASGPA
jgi:excisionase family DNA binding protein